MNYLVCLVRLLADRVIELSTMHMNQRLYAELLRLSNFSEKECGAQATIRSMPTHADIANRVFTQRKAVNRALKQLMDSDVIENT